MVSMINDELTKREYNVVVITPEETDIPLTERCNRINALCTENGAQNVLLVSVHVNAAGSDKKWHNARGFLSFVALKSSENSKILAQSIADEAYKLGLAGNRCVPEERYTKKNLKICRVTKCPAVLTENMFMDNEEDVEFLLSAEGMQKLCTAHVNGIINYIEQL